MVARIRSDRGELLVTFVTEGGDPEIQLASSGEAAVRVAVLMIARRPQLYHGDALTVRNADEAPSATVLRGPGGDRMKIVIDLPDDQAMALAQLTKRMGHDDAERLSNRFDGGAERDAMLSGIDTLQRALREAGFAPR